MSVDSDQILPQETVLNDTRVLQALNRVANALAAERELANIVQLVVDAGKEISGAAFGAFFYNVKNEKGESYQLFGLSGAPREAFSKFPMPRNTAIFAPTFEGKGIVRIADVLQDPRYGKSAPYHGMPAGHLPVRSYLAAPVTSRDGMVLGGLFFGHPDPGVFTESVERTMAGLAAQAAIAIDNASLYSSFQRELAASRSGELVSRRLAAIVESSDDAIIAKDLNGIITAWNKGAERIFGYVEAEMIGKSILTLIPPELHREEPVILARIASGASIDHYETRRVRKDGVLIDVSISASPIKDRTGKIVGASKIARDITGAKRAEKELKTAHEALEKANRELEQRVQERTAALAEAVAQMEEFSYTVSHDLRAPLRAIETYSGVLAEEYAALLPAEGKHCITRISENVRRMDKMARDVLMYSRASRTTIKLERTSLRRLIPDLIEHYPNLQAPRAEVVLGHLADVMADESCLVQAVSNLLDNAVKFVPTGVKPRIELWTEALDGRIRLWIKDNGIGIEPHLQERLFRMFERVHTNLHYEGTGAGLAIVRKAMARMQGTVGVTSDGQTGSQFWIELQAAS